jgi:hypothetical protein
MNTQNEHYRKLVDLYAGRELPADLDHEMELAAFSDQELADDMLSLRQTVDLVQSEEGPSFTEESYQRILMKLYARGVEIQTSRPEPVHLQYQLPIQG